MPLEEFLNGEILSSRSLSSSLSLSSLSAGVSSVLLLGLGFTGDLIADGDAVAMGMNAGNADGAADTDAV